MVVSEEILLTILLMPFKSVAHFFQNTDSKTLREIKETF